MPALDRAGYLGALKERYPYERVAIQGYKANVLWSIIPKDPNAGGEHAKIPLEISSNQAVSASFASALALAASAGSTLAAFKFDTKDLYGIAQVPRKTIKRSKGNLAAFMEAMQHELDSVMRTLLKKCNVQLYRDGTGFIGQGDGASAVTGKTFKLKYPWMAHCFSLGMTVGAALNAASAIRTGTAKVTGIDFTTGILTTTADDWDDQIALITNADYLFPVGDYTAANDKLALFGLGAWCPAAAPTSGDSFGGLDRSVAPQLLAGTRYTPSGEPLSETLTNAQSAGSSNGANPKICMMNPINHRKLLAELGSKRVYSKVPVMGEEPIADLGFSSIVVDGALGPIDVLPDPHCPGDASFMFDPDLLSLKSYDPFPGVFDDEGEGKQMVYNADASQCRFGGYAELLSNQPDSIVRIIHA
jgi:hypothetical protein